MVVSLVCCHGGGSVIQSSQSLRYLSLFFFFFSYSFLQSFQSFLCVFSMAKKSFLFLMFFYISHFFLSFFIKERGNKKWLPVCWVTCDMSYSEKFIS